MSVFDGNLGIVNARRAGTISDPFLSITESVKVTKGRCILREIPDKFSGLTITNGTTSYSVVDAAMGTLPSPTVIAVDYTQGILNCDPSLEGLTLNCSYKGTGIWAVSGNRIFSLLDSNNNILQTLDDWIATAQAPVNNFTSTIGNYDNTKSYVINNIVNFNGGFYVCIANTTGNSPTANSNNTYWKYWMGANTQLSTFTNEVTVTSTVSSVQVGISAFNATQDTLIVHKNSTYMQLGVDYNVSGSSVIPVGTGATWVGTTSTPLVFDFLVLKNTVSTILPNDGSLLNANSVGNAQLASDIKVGSLANLQTTDKSSAVAAINENVGKINTLTTNQGTLSNLETSTKTDLVSAINENIIFRLMGI